MTPRTRLILVTLLLMVTLGLAWAQQNDWDARERKSLDDVVYPQAAGLPDLAAIKATLERALAQDASAVPQLSALVGHSNEYVAMAAARALGRFPDAATTSLLKQTFAREQRNLVRAAALVGLARMRDPGTSALAISVLDDPSPTLQAAAVGSLQELGDKANGAVLLAFYDRYPDEAVLEALGHLGDLPGSTAVQAKLVAETFNKENEVETRLVSALALRTMGHEDLARPMFDWEATRETYQSFDILERRVRALAATKNVTIKAQGDVDRLLHDVLAADAELARRHGNDGWNRAIRAEVVGEGTFRLVSNGPDQQPDTADDISSAEIAEAYVKRTFPDLF